MFDGALQRHLKTLGLDPATVSESLPETLTLSWHDGVLSLCDRQQPAVTLAVDFLSGAMRHRTRQPVGGEYLVKACRIKGQTDHTVLDATCGMGTDSFLLHQAGFAVSATESHPVIQALLTDGLSRHQQQTGVVPFALHMADARQLLDSQSFDVVYLDPMFPDSGKSAKNKKAMQWFQALHQGQADEALELLLAARASAASRVVIKRPPKAPTLTAHKPTFQIGGKSCRFDVYQN